MDKGICGLCGAYGCIVEKECQECCNSYFQNSTCFKLCAFCCTFMCQLKELHSKLKSGVNELDAIAIDIGIKTSFISKIRNKVQDPFKWTTPGPFETSVAEFNQSRKRIKQEGENNFVLTKSDEQSHPADDNQIEVTEHSAMKEDLGDVIKSNSSKSNAKERNASEKVECYFCKKRLIIRHGIFLETHYKLHTKEDFLQCKHCGKEFSRAKSLEEHTIAQHGTEAEKQAQKKKRRMREVVGLQTRPIVCYFCGAKRRKFSMLTSHINQVHIKEIPLHKCPQCSKIYPYKSTLKYHQKRGCDAPSVGKHQRNKKPQPVCYFCQKRFKYVFSLEEHLRTHTEEPLQMKCTHCGKVLRSDKVLKEHIVSLHGSKKDRLQILEKRRLKRQKTKLTAARKCYFCGIHFGELRSHMNNVHLMEFARYDCMHCKRNFRSLYNLKKHQERSCKKCR